MTISRAPSQEHFIGRQPILDRHGALAAFGLYFCDSQSFRHTPRKDDLAVTPTIVSTVFNEQPLTSALFGCNDVIFYADERILKGDALAAFPPAQTILYLLAGMHITPDIVQRCHQLKDAGYRLALGAAQCFDPNYVKLLPLLNMVGVDIRQRSATEINTAAVKLGALNAKLFAESVESREQFEWCKNAGFEYFQGYYFTQPLIVAGKRVTPSQQGLLELLSMATAEESTNQQIENAIKRYPDLTVNMLRLVNSVGFGARTQIDSISHALVVLGRKQLLRWLQLLLFTQNTSGGIQNPLLQIAAARGRLMELMAGELLQEALSLSGGRNLMDSAFMTGLLSLSDALLSLPMESILGELQVIDEIVAALRREEGVLGQLLRMARTLEQQQVTQVNLILGNLPGLTLSGVANAQHDTIKWVNQLINTR